MRSLSNKRITRRRRRVASTLAVAIVTFGLAIGGIAAFALDDPSGGPDFTLTVSPGPRTVFRGTAATYRATVSRVNGFNGEVALSVSNLPPNTSATWTLSDGTTSNVIPPNSRRATLTVQTSSTTPLGSRTLTVTATGSSGQVQLEHSADVTLNVRILFRITGNLADPLYPGANLPLNVTLTNPRQFDLDVNAVTARVTHTGMVGCGTPNFSVAQIPSSVYPIRLGAGDSKTLQELGVPAEEQPRITMLDTRRNQNACKGAELRLAYGGSGSR